MQQSSKLSFYVVYAWTLLSQPDDRGPVPTIHQCCYRPLRGRSHGSRFRFSQSEFGKLLHRLCSVSDQTLPSALFCRRTHLCRIGGSQTIGGYQTVQTVEGTT